MPSPGSVTPFSAFLTARKQALLRKGFRAHCRAGGTLSFEEFAARPTMIAQKATLAKGWGPSGMWNATERLAALGPVCAEPSAEDFPEGEAWEALDEASPWPPHT